MDNNHKTRTFALAAALSPLLSATMSAKCGGVDYSWGADALAMMHDYIVTMMLYVLYIAYAVAGVARKTTVDLLDALISIFLRR